MAQLVARLFCKEEVRSSNLLGSTKIQKTYESMSFVFWQEIRRRRADGPEPVLEGNFNRSLHESESPWVHPKVEFLKPHIYAVFKNTLRSSPVVCFGEAKTLLQGTKIIKRQWFHFTYLFL